MPFTFKETNFSGLMPISCSKIDKKLDDINFKIMFKRHKYVPTKFSAWKSEPYPAVLEFDALTQIESL